MFRHCSNLKSNSIVAASISWAFLSIIGLIMLFATVGYGQILKADYQFAGNLNSSAAGAPAMANLTGSDGANSFQSNTIDGFTRQSLRFPFNSGVAVNTNSVIPSSAYTIVMLFRFDEISDFRRVASFDNGTSDNGAYIQDGRLEFENVANTPITSNTQAQSNGTPFCLMTDKPVQNPNIT